MGLTFTKIVNATTNVMDSIVGTLPTVAEPIVGTDSLRTAIGKTQAQINEFIASQYGRQKLSQSMEIYVSNSGTDVEGNGTQESPYKTIQWAIDAATRYDVNGNFITIHIADGIYTETATFKEIVGGGMIEIRGQSRDGTILRGGPAGAFMSQPMQRGGMYSVSNLTVDPDEQIPAFMLIGGTFEFSHVKLGANVAYGFMAQYPGTIFSVSDIHTEQTNAYGLIVAANASHCMLSGDITGEIKAMDAVISVSSGASVMISGTEYTSLNVIDSVGHKAQECARIYYVGAYNAVMPGALPNIVDESSYIKL